MQILWQNLFNICCHDKTQEISSWRKKVCLSWKSLSLPILPWKIPEQSQFDKTYGEIFMQTGTRNRLQIKVSTYLSFLIVCPCAPSIQTVSVKKTKHLELSEIFWLCVKKYLIIFLSNFSRIRAKTQTPWTIRFYVCSKKYENIFMK